jgi:hypothetical protein
MAQPVQNVAAFEFEKPPWDIPNSNIQNGASLPLTTITGEGRLSRKE